MRVFRCPMCNSTRFKRFFFFVGDRELREMSQEELEEELRLVRSPDSDPSPTHVVLRCGRCGAPTRLDKDDVPLEITIYVKGESEEPLEVVIEDQEMSIREQKQEIERQDREIAELQQRINRLEGEQA